MSVQFEPKRLSAHILGEPYRAKAAKFSRDRGAELSLDEKLTVFKLVMLLKHPEVREGTQLPRREPFKLSA